MLANRRVLDLNLLGRQGIDKLTVEPQIPPIASRANHGVHLIVGTRGHSGKRISSLIPLAFKADPNASRALVPVQPLACRYRLPKYGCSVSVCGLCGSRGKARRKITGRKFGIAGRGGRGDHRSNSSFTRWVEDCLTDWAPFC
jgi:hypothetical protein